MTAVARTVGRFEIIRRIGFGGMAFVYLARQTDLDREVALKELAALQMPDVEAETRFLQESRVAGNLNHPNIVTVHDYFVDGATPYIAMEYLAAGSLRPHISKLSFAQLFGVLEGVLAGLAHAQRRGVVHRDLKPENLLVTDEGHVKIADFGIAKVAHKERSRRLTTAGKTVGTPAYIAPEQATNGWIGPATDLYSLGCVTYEALLGEVPFKDVTSPSELMRLHATEPVPAPHEVEPSIHPRLSAWVAKLLVVDPAHRTQDAREAWRELEDIALSELGERWHHGARLIVDSEQRDVKPLMPAPFTPPATATSGEFDTYRPAVGQPPLPPLLRPKPRAPERPTPRPEPGTTPILDEAEVDPVLETTIAPDVPEAPSEEPPGRRRWPYLVAAAAALAAVVAAIAFTVVDDDAEPQTPTPAAASVVRSGPLQLQAPSGWPSAPAPTIPGFPLRDATAVGDARRGWIVAGFAPRAAYNASLLSPTLLHRLGLREGVTPRRSKAPLAIGDSFRYPDLRPDGFDHAATLYLVPTDKGVATVACIRPDDADASFERRCDVAAASLRGDGVQARGLAPTAEFREELTSAIETLSTRLTGPRARLRDARTAAGQSSTATGIAEAYEAVAGALRQDTVSPADAALEQALRDAMSRSSRQFARLAGAAKSDDKRAYDNAAEDARSAEAAVTAALRAARDAGYTLPAGAYQRTRIPALRRKARPTPTATATHATATPTATAPPTMTPTPPAATVTPERTPTATWTFD